jgi:hypothetical protein
MYLLANRVDPSLGLLEDPLAYKRGSAMSFDAEESRH